MLSPGQFPEEFQVAHSIPAERWIKTGPSTHDWERNPDRMPTHEVLQRAALHEPAQVPQTRWGSTWTLHGPDADPRTGEPALHATAKVGFSETHATISRIDAHGKVKRQGYGTKLMNKIHEAADSADLPVRLEAVYGADPFYERFGYKYTHTGTGGTHHMERPRRSDRP